MISVHLTVLFHLTQHHRHNLNYKFAHLLPWTVQYQVEPPALTLTCRKSALIDLHRGHIMVSRICVVLKLKVVYFEAAHVKVAVYFTEKKKTY